MTDKPLRATAVEIVRHLQSAGFSAFWVGGCVRDFLLGREPDDFDIATEEEFLSGKTDIEVLNDIEITCATIKSFHKKIIMLNYQR